MSAFDLNGCLNYHFDVGLEWSQAIDFDHAVLDLNDVLQMGLKRGKLAGFDRRLSHENRTMGQKQYLVTVCDFHQNHLR